MGDEYLSVISYAEACCISYKLAYNAKSRPGTFNNFEYFYKNYLQWKSDYGLIDFSDMLNLAIKSDISPTLPVLLIDEAQDLSRQQWNLINEISEHTKEIIVTGDPDQALFIWGGADPQLMISWAKDNDAKITELSQSYRVPITPHIFSCTIINKVKNRYKKTYLPTDKTGSIDRFLSIMHYDFANLDSALILYRNHILRKAIEEELIFKNKAYTTLNGYTGPCHNKYGRGIKAWISIQKSDFPDQGDINKIKVIATPVLLKIIRNNDLEKLKSIPATKALSIPYEMYQYYQHVDFSKEGNIKLSTIHGAKGMEHDLVILINGLTPRVMDEAIKNPDPEYMVWYVAVTRTKDKLHIIDAEGAIL